MSDPTQPFWFKQRQAKLEPAGTPNLYRVTAPIAPEVFIGIRQADGGPWTAFLKTEADKEPAQTFERELDNPTSAWEAAFELYRQHVIY